MLSEGLWFLAIVDWSRAHEHVHPEILQNCGLFSFYFGSSSTQRTSALPRLTNSPGKTKRVEKPD